MIIFIESNTSGTGEYFYKLCLKRKINFIFLIKSNSKYPWLNKKHYYLVDTNNLKELEKKIKIILSKNKIQFILSTSDQYIITSNKLNNKFKINYENLALLKIFKNKKKCLDMLRKLKLVKRKSLIIKNKYQSLRNINFPCIIKPNNGTGSTDVSKIENQTKLISKIKYFFKNNLKVLVEEFVDGKEYSLEVFFLKGKIAFEQLVEKKINDKFHFVESGHLIKPRYNSRIISAKNTILKTIEGFKLNKMFLHIEFKLNQNYEAEIIEINPRLAGGFIPILIKQATKVDLINFYLDMILDNLNNEIEKYNFSEIYKIFFLIPKRSKKLSSIKINNKVNKYIIKKMLYHDKIRRFTNLNYNFSDRMGHIILKSKTIKKLNNLEKIIRSNIAFIYK